MIQRIVMFLAALTSLVALAGCGGHASLDKLPPANQTVYTLDAGDKLQVTVFNEPRLTGAYTVADNGQVSMPLLGAVNARGLTITQFQQAIVSNLQQQNLVLNPGVSVQIEQFRPFFILGEVSKPGQYPYVEGMTVLTAVAIAGGFTFRADKATVSVTRKNGGKTQEFKATRESQILPGDVINVFESYL
jgi:polysaccharide biosynthesis/export protein